MERNFVLSFAIQMQNKLKCIYTYLTFISDLSKSLNGVHYFILQRLREIKLHMATGKNNNRH